MQHDFWGDDGRAANLPGRRAYNSNCAGCHGLDGRGGDKGADIAGSARLRRLPDSQVFAIVSNGIAGTGMPAFHSLHPQEVHAIVNYVRVLQGNLQARTPPGDAVRGKEVFFGKGGCSNCHAISGQGGFLGPDLSTYGLSLSASTIREDIVRSKRTEPAGYRSVVVTTREGERLEGVIRNEDNFSLQLLTKDGNFHFFEKSELQALDRPGQSLMPANYGEQLSLSELNDLVSYLMKADSSLRKAQSLSGNEGSTQ